jgi:hypothetical protein
MRANPIVTEKVKCKDMTVIIELFGEAICQSREPAHLHAHRQIVPFGVRCIDISRIGIATDRFSFNTHNLRRADYSRRESHS